MPEGTWELVCHPGYCDASLRAAGTRLLESREIEREALLEVVPEIAAGRLAHSLRPAEGGELCGRHLKSHGKLTAVCISASLLRQPRPKTTADLYENRHYVLSDLRRQRSGRHRAGHRTRRAGPPGPLHHLLAAVSADGPRKGDLLSRGPGLELPAVSNIRHTIWRWRRACRRSRNTTSSTCCTSTMRFRTR